MKYGVVVIGRNEGERLRQCLMSLPAACSKVYVDSGSIDGSVQRARDLGAEVTELDVRTAFTTARARNAGYQRLCEMSPGLEYVQFLDGDCELIAGWVENAISFLNVHRDVGVVCGRRRERYPEESIYNWLCDREWDQPTGEVHACGGDAMMRRNAVEAAGGYRDDLIAGEEPELCVRLRQAGWRVWRLDREMTLHDAAMTRFGQWWRRALRGGYAFAQGAYLHGASTERYCVWESRRAWFWGVWLPLTCLAVGLAFAPWGWVAWLVFPLQILRQTVRNHGPVRERAALALFQLLARFAESYGQIKFMWDRLLDRQTRLIEYK
jgi:glycosyltransferase involved in cell wall biosynthesis